VPATTRAPHSDAFQLSPAITRNSNGTGKRSTLVRRRRPVHSAVAVAAIQKAANQRSRSVLYGTVWSCARRVSAA
jgi:hypothetical protein